MNDRTDTGRTASWFTSVVVPARNAASTIGEQLDALMGQSVDPGTFEVLVVDDASTDATGRIVDSYVDGPCRVRLVHVTTPLGPSGARNLGVERSASSHLAFCDADDIVDPRWLEHLLVSLHEYDVVGGPCVSFRTAANGTRVVDERIRLVAPRRFDHLEFVGSGNFAVSRKWFTLAGGFREDWWCGEDVELSWRLQHLGARLGWNPDAILLRREKGGLRSTIAQGLQYGLADARLVKEFRDDGAAAPSTRAAIGAVRRAAREWSNGGRTEARRLDLVSELARQAGRLRGSARYRVWCP